MKKVLILILLAVFALNSIGSLPAYAHWGPKGHKHYYYNKVRSYTKKDGTHVRSHYRRTH